MKPSGAVSLVSHFVSLPVFFRRAGRVSTEHRGLSRVAENISERTSSGSKEVFYSPGNGVGKERSKRKNQMRA